MRLAAGEGRGAIARLETLPDPTRPSMRHLRFLSAALVACSLTFAHDAFSAVPDPPNSTVPDCLVACPFGDIEYTVIVRDVLAVPQGNVLVQLNLCACDSLEYCPAPQGVDPFCLRSGITGADGKFTFKLRMGGTGCAGRVVEVRGDGVLLNRATVRTVDLDGSLVVDGADVALVTSLIGSGGPVGDVDCNFAVNQADVDLVAGRIAGSDHDVGLAAVAREERCVAAQEHHERHQAFASCQCLETARELSGQDEAMGCPRRGLLRRARPIRRELQHRHSVEPGTPVGNFLLKQRQLFGRTLPGGVVRILDRELGQR